MSRLDLVTGAFGFTGRHIAKRLLDRGIQVRTLTRGAAPPDSTIEALPYSFDDPVRLAESLEGVHTLYNTYWVRFDHRRATYKAAVSNTRSLFRAAQAAGVARVVHVSIANPSENSDLPYYEGKAQLERDLIDSDLSYAILRPTVLFGDRGILINNIAWLLRRLPVFAIVGSGAYSLQPAHVDDLARLAVEAGDRTEAESSDVAGPETYTYEELVLLIRDTIDSRARLVHVPVPLGLWTTRAMGLLLRDVLVTREELIGLQRDILVSQEQPRGQTRLSDWLPEHRDSLGTHYMSELALHYRAEE